MQTFFLFTQTTTRGAQVSDPSIEGSGLATLIKQTFQELSLPANIGGCLKLQQRHDNPDAFDLYFYSNVDSETYRVDGTYSARDIAAFGRTEFNDFPDTEPHARRRLAEFARRLIAGQLVTPQYT